MSSLKPCPFCGGEQTMLFRPNCNQSSPYNPGDSAFPHVRCMTCFAEAVGVDWDHEGQSAIAAWNRRAPLQNAAPSEVEGSSGAGVQTSPDGLTETQHSAGWRPISCAPRDGTHILALQANTSFGWFNGVKAPEVQTVVHWWANPGEEGFYTSVNELEPQNPFPAAYWKPLDGLVRDPLARCGRCGARHIEHDLEPVGFTCPDREGAFSPAENSAHSPSEASAGNPATDDHHD